MTKFDEKVDALLAKHPSLTRPEAEKVLTEKNERKKIKRTERNHAKKLKDEKAIQKGV